jgi:hypothetical protein
MIHVQYTTHGLELDTQLKVRLPFLTYVLHIDIIPQDILVFSIMIMSRYGCWFATYGTGTDTDTDYGTEYKTKHKFQELELGTEYRTISNRRLGMGPKNYELRLYYNYVLKRQLLFLLSVM